MDDNVETLLITDDFMKGKTIDSRKLNIKVVERVKSTGGKV